MIRLIVVGPDFCFVEHFKAEGRGIANFLKNIESNSKICAVQTILFRLKPSLCLSIALIAPQGLQFNLVGNTEPDERRPGKNATTANSEKNEKTPNGKTTAD